MNSQETLLRARELFDKWPALRLTFADPLDLARVLPDDHVTGFVSSRFADHRRWSVAYAVDGLAMLEAVQGPRRALASFVPWRRSGSVLTLYLFGPLSMDRLAGAADVPAMLEAIAANQDAAAIVLRVASPGGIVEIGNALAEALIHAKPRTVAMIDRHAFSMAGVLALVCDRVAVREDATLMLHRKSQPAFGNAEQLRAAAAELAIWDGQQIRLIARRRRVHADVVRGLVDAGRYLSAPELRALGLADSVLPSLRLPPAAW